MFEIFLSLPLYCLCLASRVPFPLFVEGEVALDLLGVGYLENLGFLFFTWSSPLSEIDQKTRYTDCIL